MTDPADGRPSEEDRSTASRPALMRMKDANSANIDRLEIEVRDGDGLVFEGVKHISVSNSVFRGVPALAPTPLSAPMKAATVPIASTPNPFPPEEEAAPEPSPTGIVERTRDELANRAPAVIGSGILYAAKELAQHAFQWVMAKIN